jgi:hypothetical protein
MQTVAELSWTEFKASVEEQKLYVRFISLPDVYRVYGIDGQFSVECSIIRSESNADLDDFEANYKSLWSKPIKQEVQTQSEVDNKALKTVQVMGVTDADGRCELRLPMPIEGRWFAYGDAEFKTRHFWDRVERIYLEDTPRDIAWAMALGMDPGATEPLPDEAVIAAGADAPGGPYPEYPSVGEYHDTGISVGSEIYAGGPPSHCPGMAMTYQYGTTEATPVGGYAWVPGKIVPGMPGTDPTTFVIVMFKGEDCETGREGQWCKASIDMAKNK